jgi:hypothetical protein
VTVIARSVMAVVVAVLAPLVGACEGDPAPGDEGDRRDVGEAAAAAGAGVWQRLHGPARRAQGLQFLVPVMAGEKIVVTAGVDYDQATMKALVFDPASRRWSPAAPSRVWWRGGHTALGVGDQVIVWGGCCGGGGHGSQAPG